MVCKKCRDQDHELCRRGTWCDCGHRVIQKPEPKKEPRD